MKKHVIIRMTIMATLLFGIVTLSGCASCSRSMKSFTSDVNGGLDRTVTVYDYQGEEIQSWSGKFDLSESENEIFFDDADGKRVIIHGGIVISEEN